VKCDIHAIADDELEIELKNIISRNCMIRESSSTEFINSISTIITRMVGLAGNPLSL